MKAVKSCILTAVLAGVAVFANDASPVRKVITLLQDLKAKIEEDEGLDTKAYEAYMCWCDKVDEAKTASIAKAKTTIADLAASIKSLTFDKEKYEQELEQNEKDTKDTQDEKDEEQQTFDTAETSYFQQEAEMNEVLGSITKARGLLGAKDLLGLLQEDDSPVLLAFKDVIKALPVTAQLPQKSLELLSQATSSTSWQAPSMADSMIGILDSLKQTYGEEDAKMLKDYKEVKAKHVEDQRIFQEQLDQLAKDKATLSSNLAKTKQDLADDKTMKAATERQLKEDEDFLANTTKSKSKRQEDFTARQSERQKELDGVNTALGTLTDEKARELAARSIKTVAFLQVSSHSDGQLAVKTLQEQAAKIKSVRLATLAKEVKRALPDGFKDTGGGIMGSMDTMINELKAEQQSDEDKKVHCVSEYQAIDKEVNKLTFLVQKNEATISTLNDKIDSKTEQSNAASFEIGENEKEIAKITEIRADEKAVYDKEKKDDESAIELLKLTHSQLAKFYEGSLVQLKQDPKEMLKGEDLSQENKDLARQEQGYTLSDKNSNKGAADMILALIDRIVSNLEDEVSTATKEENDNIADFDAQKKSLEDDNADLREKRVDLASMMANHRKDINDEEDKKTTSNGGIDDKNKYKGSIQDECDFIISKYNERFDKRQAEIAGINTAKDFLYHSGVFGEPKAESFFQTASRRFLGIKRH
mmetsp:Transcript_22155/g.39825  ORF Transcript_22155/g.39825 Transcript_22155/m.39825 type:complete len:702 (-) Transcript_22155:34-2139(-)|eukprot:CAMPEP_0197650680 /NCGR_PEP_ID=MMETSP1338-20131121/31087_1 /TAXON_ID=43686 ORGANISM="Pelagodinium beii, Strain RCC1491" /NCGR_SAMPLE_ID=MMETSP1338 /ASSEMBLY_ACC=CAM_ASM_000754 /LENGTH=701 /DNA_ID=CAMNT_0043225137 /DNA_START=69 /DNA_END=2174 /DNA_ORIENTATION=-